MKDHDRRIVLVTRRTRLAGLVARHNTIEQARFHAERLGMDFADFLEEDRIQRQAVARVEAVLLEQGRLQCIDRGLLPNFLFPPDALVVVVGQDGLVANTLKYLDGHRVLAVNPDPSRWDGVLLPFVVEDLERALADAWKNHRPVREIAIARARLSDGQQLFAVNDFFIGTRGHASARYEIALGDRHERQSSSGIIVSTGLGSTGWLRSVLTGAAAIAGPADVHVAALRKRGFAWDARRLVFSVREPFPSRWSQAGLVFGDLHADASLCVRSLMPEGGIVFSDGMEADGLDFRSGLEVRIDLSERRGHLLH